MAKRIDLSGKKFGDWDVLSFAGVSKSGMRMWRCKCKCGVIKNVDGGRLRSGKSRSCGCNRYSARKRNDFVVNGTVVYVQIKDSSVPMICDLDDWMKLKHFYWSINTQGYAYTVRNKKHIMFHTLIVDCDGDKERDHANRNKLDNRKENIRLVTHKENIRNMGLKKNNKSGHTGVYFDSKRCKWCATITVDGRNIGLGRFPDIESAVLARKSAEIQYWKGGDGID